VSKRPSWAVWIATCGPLGYFPIGPGSVGAALGVLLVVALAQLPIATGSVTALVGLVAAALFAVGVPASKAAERYFGRKDPGTVVIDEVVGQMVTLLAATRSGWKGLTAAFLLFRCFDVIKPFPARRLERAPGGWGIMLDDVAAGAWSLAVFGLASLLANSRFRF
jgi:phosphatidylglycerophosphatase A